MHYVQLGIGGSLRLCVALWEDFWQGGVSCRGKDVSWLWWALVASQGHRGQGHAYACVYACVCVCACGVVGGSWWLVLGGWGLWVWWWLSGCLGGCGGVWVGSLVALGRGRSGLGLWVWSGGLVLGGFWTGSHRVAKVHFTLTHGLLLAYSPLARDSSHMSPLEVWAKRKT